MYLMPSSISVKLKSLHHAGELGAVTIATNMAGRGTDIKLGAGVVDSRRSLYSWHGKT